MATFEFHIDEVEDALESAKSMDQSSVFLPHEIDTQEIIEWIDSANDYDRDYIIAQFVKRGEAIWPDERNSGAEDAIATLRHKMTTLALYPDMTALDVLDYIEEAIK